jgi:hypothetical protein
MSLSIFNKNKITDIIKENSKFLTIDELLTVLNYTVNKIFYDKLYHNIENDKWLYIDNEMLSWFGFNRSEIKKNKQDYIKLIEINFEENTDYKFLNNKEFQEISKCQILALENKEVNSHNKTKHLIVSPDCFKLSLMLLRTEKSKEIREYYIELEKIFKFYLEYQNQYKLLELENKQEELEEKISYQEEENKLEKTNLYLEKFTNKKCIYLFEIIELITKNKYIKLGSTKDLIQRYLTLKQKFKIINILNVFECNNNYIEVENDILNDTYIKNNLYKELINGNKSIEIVKINEICTYEKIIKIVKKYINNIYSLTPIQILENKRLELENNKINMINKLLENGYDPTEIINKFFANNKENNINITDNNNINNQENINNTQEKQKINIQYIKSIKKPTSKPIHKLDPDTFKIIKSYDTLSLLLIEEEELNINNTSIYKALRTNMIYKNYRWIYDGDVIKPNNIDQINNLNIETIVQLNDTQDKIINTYATQTDLAKLEKISRNTIKNVIKNNTIYKNYYYKLLKDCDNNLINDYISNGNIIKSYKTKTSQTIIKYDLINNIEIKYNSLSETLLKNHLSSNRLKYAITNNILLDGFYWKYE